MSTFYFIKNKKDSLCFVKIQLKQEGRILCSSCVDV